jgi:hypothetical protein
MSWKDKAEGILALLGIIILLGCLALAGLVWLFNQPHPFGG